MLVKNVLFNSFSSGWNVMAEDNSSFMLADFLLRLGFGFTQVEQCS